MTHDPARGAVLVADDDDALRRVLVRAVEAEGYRAHAVANGDAAVEAFGAQSFDMVLSDIDMPGRNGIALLRAIRERDLDIPVVLVTGGPTLATAMAAVEHGASHYLTKPVDATTLRGTIRRAMHAGALARARRRLAELPVDGAMQIADLAGLGARFNKALDSLYMMCQPIVRWSTRTTFAYEALARSAEPTIPLPDALFDAADRLDRLHDIGGRVRALCGDVVGAPQGLMLFVNLHTSDLLDETLFAPDTPLSRIANRVTLEITERARLETVSDVAGRVARLRTMGFKIAIDDIGAGYAGLTSFAALEPDFVKLDRALVQNITASAHKMKLVGAMIRASQDLNVEVIGEGVESATERDALVELGCDLFQGYLFARPAVPFVQPTF